MTKLPDRWPTPRQEMNPGEFRSLVGRMRSYQRAFFHYHRPEDLNRSKELERLVDAELGMDPFSRPKTMFDPPARHGG